ncbi:uncharacterized protein NEMAJ01_2379 [Nematocida major]|uniref:uncharacterized protein n=1 Tax=Nematocida major TaxID=1912982 RepID=UPI00200858B0|nr:uncharacterized protein NEMAJ01_2379 [Nematocida major]KAH9387483.1 hypothetical protein NEMAJ01_2379 [Nematocida major]
MKKLLESLSSRLPLLTAVASASLITGRSSAFSSYKPILSDLIKSSSVMVSLPISVGDSVSISSAKGRVSSISIHYVSLDSTDRVTYIPTHTLYNTVITKYK